MDRGKRKLSQQLGDGVKLGSSVHQRNWLHSSLPVRAALATFVGACDFSDE